MAVCISSSPNIFVPNTYTKKCIKQSKSRSTSTTFQDEFTILKALGEGLQGQVMLAFDAKTQEYVAIKCPTDIQTCSSKALKYQNKCLLHEYNMQSRIQHHNVLSTIRIVRSKRHGYPRFNTMVTDFAIHGDIFGILAKSGALTEKIAKFYFYQLIQAIQACHVEGVVHRDIKPENLLLDDTFQLKLCDFGLACATASGNVDNFIAHDVVGTDIYMAPEVLGCPSQGYQANRVDIWAAGVVLFIMLTGCPPYMDPTMEDECYNCLSDQDYDQFWNIWSVDFNMDVNTQAMDLINGLLCADVNSRLTLKDIQAHPWLQDVKSINQTDVYNEMYQRYYAY